MRERLINRSRQGDLGEAAAIEWLTGVGAIVLIPFGYSPDFDLVAQMDGALKRVQVKTSTLRETTPDGHLRWSVRLSTSGGNQSWSRVIRRLDTTRCDAVFVLVGDGRRWLIPTSAIDAGCALSLGGPKYSEFEIFPAGDLNHLVYGDSATPLESPIAGGAPKLESRARL